MSRVSFLGNSLDEIRAFPAAARREIGFQIDRLQNGLEPNDWKPLRTVGPGVREIRVRDMTGAFRAIYLATLPDAVYVLHAFMKKTQATPQRDIDIAALRLKQLMQRIRDE